MIIVSTTILSFSFKVWVDLYVLHGIIFRIGNKQSSLMFAFLFFLQIVLRYHHACCPGMIDLGVLCLGLFFDKLCATFSGMDQICVHKTTVWKGLLDHKKWMISYRQVVKPATPNNLSNIVANEEKNDTNMISWQDQCCLFALICFRFLSFVFYRAKYVATVFLCHHSPTLCFLVFFLEYLNIPRWLTLTFD